MQHKKFEYTEKSSISIERVMGGYADSAPQDKIRVIHYAVMGDLNQIADIFECRFEDISWAFRKFGVKRRLITKGKDILKAAEAKVKQA